MSDLSGFRNAEVQFDRTGTLVGTADDVLGLARSPETTDLVVFCHGWNNDMGDARDLYGRLAAALRNVVASVPGINDRGVAIAGVLWPSKKFDDAALIPGGAAAFGSGVDSADILAQVDNLRDVFPEAQAQLDAVAKLVPSLEDQATARAGFADGLRSLLDRGAAEQEDGSDALFSVSPGQLLDRLAVPITLVPPTPAHGGAAALGDLTGGAAGLGSLVGGVWGAARNLLNYTTYYEMKSRAGQIGQAGLAPAVLAPVRTARPNLRLHLVGHSFGARLVSAAAAALAPESPGPITTLALLQAAFSHYGFADQWAPGQNGAFREVITAKKVTGPALITHTANDRSVGIAYAIASRVAGQIAAALGDANDPYGGLGRNGAQRTPEAINTDLLDVGGRYQWQFGRPHNLLADRFISGHSDITGPQVAYALLRAISASQPSATPTA